MDQGVNTGLSPLDGCAEIAITESKTKPVATQKPSLAFFIYYFFLLCPSKQLPDSEKTNVGYLIFTFLCCYVMLCYVMLCYVMLCYVMFLWHFLGIHLTAKVPVVSLSNSIPQLHPVEGRNQVNHEDIICSLPQFTQKELRCR